ncbi:DUF4349 domain-containing protein [Novosphingobium sp. TCA1]|uniref:DUF4349 domain-containing protein n=1 Tax=Novosphingobium sp. TCA1 TaxID=2682474 RepID=UPI00130AF364|nr:DUF4349 domain-containing protein [Novosphingobium sp. TCA1]GFE72780.1 hypothetical protein NTCA1_04290 [Novosphingobium sp. TCA1]
MRKTFMAMTFLMLAGCGSEPPSQLRKVTEDAKEEAPGAGKDDKDNPIAVSAPNAPKIAYVYEYGYRLAAASIPEVQRKQADLCEKQGPQVCQILDMKQSGSEGDYASGSLSLAVAAPRARAFGSELGRIAGSANGEEVSSSIAGEDLSKQIVDTEARLRARSVLRDRLMEVLASRKGTVAELVEAERGVAQVNQEIDEAKSWLAEMQGRVDYSRIELTYEAGTPSSGGFIGPIRSALGNVGSVLGYIIGFLILAATALVPLVLVGIGIHQAVKLYRRRKEPPREA